MIFAKFLCLVLIKVKDVSFGKRYILDDGLKQLIQPPTRVTCSTSTVIDHILPSAPSRVSQKGVINVGVSDH